MENKCNNNLIYLEKNSKIIPINKKGNYQIEELKSILNIKTNIIYTDYELDEIEITEHEEIKYFLQNLKYIKNKIIINKNEYNIINQDKLDFEKINKNIFKKNKKNLIVKNLLTNNRSSQILNI